jgi:hypothetical protein
MHICQKRLRQLRHNAIVIDGAAGNKLPDLLRKALRCMARSTHAILTLPYFALASFVIFTGLENHK